jgi:lipoprotein-anchoring transpeptidase ErfK/SrfK
MSVLMGNARLLWVLVMATLVLSAATVASAAPLSAHRGTARATTLFILDRAVKVRAAPQAGARVVGVVPVLTPLTHSQMRLPVIQTALRGSGKWLRVRLPSRPDGATGWVRADAGTVGSTGWAIVIRRQERRALVFDHGKVLASFPIIVGKPSTPTPLGNFFVVEKLPLAQSAPGEPWALATSAYSYVFSEFAGGDGQVALHSTANMAGLLGTFSSHGCIRFAPAAITWIATHVDPGTPVAVTR